ASLERSSAYPRVGQRFPTRAPPILEASTERLIEIGAAEIEHAMPAFAAPPDRGPQKQVVRVELRVALVARAVLVDQRSVVRPEDGRRDRHLAGVRGQHEAEPWTKNALAEQAEEPPRLDGHAQAPARPQVKPVEDLEVVRP